MFTMLVASRRRWLASVLAHNTVRFSRKAGNATRSNQSSGQIPYWYFNAAVNSSQPSISS